MLESSDWLVPTLAGEPFMEKPPLYYWVSAGFAYVLSPWLPVHDGARIAAGFFTLGNLWAVGSAARKWWGYQFGQPAMLAFAACLGVLIQTHMMMPDVSLVSGFALATLGCATILRRPVAGGTLIGLGIGVGFLSKGLIAPGAIGITLLVLPACFRQWGTHAYWKGIKLAILVSLPFCLIWPGLLYVRSPSLFIEWFWGNNIGRFVGFSVWRLRTAHTPWLWTKTIPWFTFPAFVLALWTLWQRRRTAFTELPVQYSLVASSVLMAVLAASASAREIYAWPLLVPVSILAAPGAVSLPEPVEPVWTGLSCVLFGAISAALLAVWILLMISGAPPHLAPLLHFLPADFVPRFELFRAALAILLLSGVAVVVRAVRARPGKGLALWVVGMTGAWALLMILFTPWLDYAKSYRSVFLAMPLPAPTDCIASINLGEGERAMLHYVTGRDPVRREVVPDSSCTFLLVQREQLFGEPEIERGNWEEIWRGKRPGETNERFWLFRARSGSGKPPGKNRR